MEVVLLLGAERDLQEAYDWVAEHRVRKEQVFLQDLELRLEHLKQFPSLGQVYRGRYRRLLLPRYPFGIFYVVEANRIVVHAILDLRVSWTEALESVPGLSLLTARPSPLMSGS
jgi:toxin ParE1/3/4